MLTHSLVDARARRSVVMPGVLSAPTIAARAGIGPSHDRRRRRQYPVPSPTGAKSPRPRHPVGIDLLKIPETVQRDTQPVRLRPQPHAVRRGNRNMRRQDHPPKIRRQHEIVQRRMTIPRPVPPHATPAGPATAPTHAHVFRNTAPHAPARSSPSAPRRSAAATASGRHCRRSRRSPGSAPRRPPPAASGAGPADAASAPRPDSAHRSHGFPPPGEKRRRTGPPTIWVESNRRWPATSSVLSGTRASEMNRHIASRRPAVANTSLSCTADRQQIRLGFRNRGTYREQQIVQKPHRMQAQIHIRHRMLVQQPHQPGRHFVADTEPPAHPFDNPLGRGQPVMDRSPVGISLRLRPQGPRSSPSTPPLSAPPKVGRMRGRSAA